MKMPPSSRVPHVGLAVGGGVLTVTHLPILLPARMLTDQMIGLLGVGAIILIVGSLLLATLDKVFQYRLQRQRQETERMAQEKLIGMINSAESLVDFLRSRTEYEIAAQGRPLEDNVVCLRHGHPNAADEPAGSDTEATVQADEPSGSQIGERMIVIRHHYRAGCHDCSCAGCRGRQKAALKKTANDRKLRKTNGGI